MLVTETDVGHTHPHELAKYWWREGGFGQDGIELPEKGMLQGVTMLGMPRVLWSNFFGGYKRPINSRWVSGHTQSASLMGFNPGLRGWHSHWEPDVADRPYIDQDWALPDVSVEQMIFRGEYPEGDDAFFKPYRADYLTYHSIMQQRMAKAARDAGAKFATVRLPTHFGKDAPDNHAYIRPMADGYPRDWPVLSLPQTVLFPGATFDQMKDFYGNESHFNAAGARHFTRAVTPAIVKVMTEEK